MTEKQIMVLLHSSKLINMLWAIGLTLVGYLIAQRFSLFIEHTMSKRFSRHHTQLFSRLLFYTIFIIFLFSGLQHLGFNLSVLLGAAGVFTVAISFASQTAASNLISGIFLLFEHPFKVGDTIEIKGINGVVESIDLLSTKLKTSDNRLVRIPNEAMIKSEITNLSFFNTRRIDLIVDVAYHSDIMHVKTTLMALAQECKQVLDNPEPNVVINNFAASAVEVKFMVWVNTTNTTQVRNYLQEKIKQCFDQEGIEIPVPEVTTLRYQRNKSGIYSN